MNQLVSRGRTNELVSRERTDSSQENERSRRPAAPIRAQCHGTLIYRDQRHSTLRSLTRAIRKTSRPKALLELAEHRLVRRELLIPFLDRARWVFSRSVCFGGQGFGQDVAIVGQWGLRTRQSKAIGIGSSCIMREEGTHRYPLLRRPLLRVQHQRRKPDRQPLRRRLRRALHRG